MENEYRERMPDDRDADNVGGGRRSRNSKRDIARETLENLQGNVYRERTDESAVGSRFTANNADNDPKTGTGRAGADRNPRPDQPKTSRASADGNPGKSGRDPKTRDARAKKSAPKRPNIIVQVLNGDILTRDFVLNNLTYIFFFLFLLLLVVSKGYYGKQLTKDIDTLQTEVNASTAEYIENKAKLEELTSRYRLVEMLERRDLKESLKPAKVIRIKRPEK